MKTTNIFHKLKATGAYNTDGMKPQLPGLQSPLKKSPYKFNAGLKKAAVEGKLDKNPEFKKEVQSSPAMMKGNPKVPKQTKKRGNKTITVENFNYGDEFTSKVKTKQKNKKDGEVKVKVKGTSKNYDPTTVKKTGRSVTKAKAKL